MTHTHMDTLKETLQQKREADREQTEELMRSESQRLVNGFRRCVDDALNTIGADIASKTKRLKNHLLRPLMVGVVIGISLLATICGGSWATMRFISAQVQSEMQQKSTLGQEIDKQQQTLRQLQARTWGVSFYQDKTGRRYVIFPRGGQYKIWKTRGQMAVEIFGRE